MSAYHCTVDFHTFSFSLHICHLTIRDFHILNSSPRRCFCVSANSCPIEGSCWIGAGMTCFFITIFFYRSGCFCWLLFMVHAAPVRFVRFVSVLRPSYKTCFLMLRCNERIPRTNLTFQNPCFNHGQTTFHRCADKVCKSMTSQVLTFHTCYFCVCFRWNVLTPYTHPRQDLQIRILTLI